jgi:RNA polymerase sigma-70 factor (ECF subfamily)
MQKGCSQQQATITHFGRDRVNSEAISVLLGSLADAKGARVSTPASLSIAVRSMSESSARVIGIEDSDEDLLLHVSKGDKEALSVLLQRHARAVYNVARRILKDDSEAEDLVQELFLFIFRKASAFDAAKASGASWVIQMAYHRAIDRRRYLGFRQHYNAEELNEERLMGSRGQISIDELAGRALLNKLRDELSADQSQTLELHFFEGYSFHEIAEKTGQTLGNVRNHYYRGIERLRSHIFPGKTSPK